MCLRQAACSTRSFIRIRTVWSRRFCGASLPPSVTDQFASGSVMPTANQPRSSSASQSSRIGFSISAHPRDLAIYDNKWKVGFGLWNYRDPEFALEIALLGFGIVLYLARNVMLAIRKTAAIAFGIALVVVQVGDTYVPRTPLTDKATVVGVWVFYTLFVVMAFFLEKIGRRRQINSR